MDFIWFLVVCFCLTCTGQKQLETQLLHLRKTTGTILRYDHSYKIVKSLGGWKDNGSTGGKWVQVLDPF